MTEHVEVHAVSPDGRRLAYPARRGSQWVLVVDGKDDGTRYDEIRNILFSPDSKAVTFKARRGQGTAGRWAVVVNGRPEKEYDAVVDGPAFSPDGKWVGYQAETKSPRLGDPDARVVVVGGVEWSPPGVGGNPAFELPDPFPWRFRNLTPVFRFSPDSRHAAAALLQVTPRLGMRVIADGKLQERAFQQLPAIQYSPDGSRLAYAGVDKDGITVVADGLGAKTVPGDVFGNFSFSPDGKRLAYTTRDSRAGLASVWIDGALVSHCQQVRDVRFTPDAQRLAFCAQRNGVWVVDAGGREVTPGHQAGVTEPTFDPDGKRLAYVLGGSAVVVDGLTGPKHAKVVRGSLAFTPDGRHVAYAATGLGKSAWRVVVDGADAGNTFDAIWAGSGLAFDGPGRFFVVARRGDDIFRVEVQLPPG